MGTMTALRATGERLARADLDALPEDGLRHELLDGAFVMTPSSGFRHQVVVTALWRLLADAVVGDLRAMVGPFDVALPTGDLLVPDVLLARASTLTEKDLQGAPELVVEVLSPSTRRRDLGDKLTAYRDAGVPHYWVVDPLAPRLVAHELVVSEDGVPTYVVVADVTGEESWTSARPVTVTVVPADLVR